MDYALSATYSPEDNKLRLYSLHRLDPEVYERVKAAGFRWAPKQDLFVAPAWTPEREDLLIELCGEIDDEDTSLVERAEERADRFDGYREKRGAEAESARQAVDAIADNIPLGQPILVGHHSQRRAERDAQKIENGMRRAVSLWKTSKYWNSRAAGVMRHASYKHDAGKTMRRIKKLEAERRAWGREISTTERHLRNWNLPGLTRAQAVMICNAGDHRVSVPHEDGYPRSLWGVLNDTDMTTDEARSIAVAAHESRLPGWQRWVDHLTLRIGYERQFISDTTPASDDTPKIKSTRPKLPPIVNYDGEGMHHMTKAEWSAQNRDYKGTRKSEDRSYRYRVAMHNDTGNADRWSGMTLSPVFITDQKVVEPPEPELIAC